MAVRHEGIYVLYSAKYIVHVLDTYRQKYYIQNDADLDSITTV